MAAARRADPTTRSERARRSALAVIAVGALALAALAVAGAAAAASPSDPFGSLDLVRPRPGGTVEVAGWAKDPDTSQPVQVHVYVDGAGAAILTADQARPDLQAPLGEPNHGFDATLPVTEGHHVVCAYAINPAGPGGNTLLGCKGADVSSAPFGSLDLVAQQPGHLLAVGGWAKDPDTSLPVQVHVYVDGLGAAILTADQARPDLQAALGEENHGFAATIPIGDGHHDVCVYALNRSGPGGTTVLGCRGVDVSSTVVGSLDVVTNQERPSLVAPNHHPFHVAGWRSTRTPPSRSWRTSTSTAR